jgi:hypothetical protein
MEIKNSNLGLGALALVGGYIIYKEMNKKTPQNVLMNVPTVQSSVVLQNESVMSENDVNLLARKMTDKLMVIYRQMLNSQKAKDFILQAKIPATGDVFKDTENLLMFNYEKNKIITSTSRIKSYIDNYYGAFYNGFKQSLSKLNVVDANIYGNILIKYLTNDTLDDFYLDISPMTNDERVWLINHKNIATTEGELVKYFDFLKMGGNKTAIIKKIVTNY